MDFSREREYIGDLSQLFHVKEYILTGGRAEGEKAIDISTGAGLCFTVLPGRCMDISHLSMKGVNFSFIAPCGMVAPQFFSDRDKNFLKSFTAGFLTTCGLDNAGPPDHDGTMDLPMHGRINGIPAEQFGYAVDLVDGVPTLTMRGKMRQARLFGEHLWLERTYTVRYNDNRIIFNDIVTNAAYQPQEHFMLYHFNLGYPLLCEDTVLRIPTQKVTARDARAAEGKDHYDKVDCPQQDYAEMCFFHEPVADENGKVTIGMFNPRINMGFELTYGIDTLDYLVHWKMMNKGEYVIGLEPSNNLLGGRDEERAAGRLKTIPAGGNIRYDFEITVKG